MKRLAFNGGEISPAMSLRSDMDAAPRSCSLVTNWNIHATGGVSRRRGMRHLSSTNETTSRLIPYIYSAEQTYLIEIAPSALYVRSADDASVLVSFNPDDETPWQYPNLAKITWLQINAILLILSPDTPVMQLKCDEAGDWSFSPFEFVSPPWQTEDYRDIELTLTPDGSVYTPSYSAVESDDEEDTPEILPEDTEASTGDILRVSYYTKRREAFQKAAEASSGLSIVTALTNLLQLRRRRKNRLAGPRGHTRPILHLHRGLDRLKRLHRRLHLPRQLPGQLRPRRLLRLLRPRRCHHRTDQRKNLQKGRQTRLPLRLLRPLLLHPPIQRLSRLPLLHQPGRLPPPLRPGHPYRPGHPLRRQMAILLLRLLVRHIRNPPQLRIRRPHRTMGTRRRIHLLHRRHRQQPHHRQ